MENFQEIVELVVRCVRIVAALGAAGWYAYHRMRLKMANQTKPFWKCSETYALLAGEAVLLKDEVARIFTDG